MTQYIFKYALEKVGYGTIRLPEGASILSVAEQHDKPFLWALIDGDLEAIARTTYSAATGEKVPDVVVSGYTYIGTIHYQNGYVYHQFIC